MTFVTLGIVLVGVMLVAIGALLAAVIRGRYGRLTYGRWSYSLDVNSGFSVVASGIIQGSGGATGPEPGGLGQLGPMR